MVNPKAHGKHGVQITQWLNWADEDYLAARAMLLRGFVMQGAMLANTAVEKYLKTGLLARNQSFRNSHDVARLYEQLQATGSTPQVNVDFLGMLGKAYRLRYPDDLPVGFNLALVAVKVLAEMDATVHALRGGFRFQRSDGRTVTTLLDDLLGRQDLSLLSDNAAFGKCARAELFTKSSSCFEIRVLGEDEILSAKYEAGPIPDDGVFDTEALKPGISPAQL